MPNIAQHAHKLTQYLAVTGLAMITFAVITTAGLSAVGTLVWLLTPDVVAYETEANRLPNFLEVLFFVANIALVIITLTALLVVKSHATEAERAREATIYMNISTLWSSHRLQSSRMYMLQLRDRFNDPNYSDQTKRQSRTARAGSATTYSNAPWLSDEAARWLTEQARH